MSTLAGPLATFYNFLAMIAFPNCVEYFKEQEEPSDKSQRRLVRLLFNAVVAMDSAFDYRHWQSTSKELDVAVALKDYCAANNCPELLELREVSNALKHSIRAKRQSGVLERDDTKLHAHQIHETTLTGEVQFDGEKLGVNISISSKLIERADKALEKAWQYWHGWYQTATSTSI